MNDLISRQAAYDTLAEYYHLRTETQHKSLKEALSRVTTIDAVPVIRCKDCVNYRPDKAGNYCRTFGRLRMNDFFCAYGEKSEE